MLLEAKPDHEFDLLIQDTCNTAQSFWINFTIETKATEKMKPTQLNEPLPQFRIRSSPRSKLTPQTSYKNEKQNDSDDDDEIIIIEELSSNANSEATSSVKNTATNKNKNNSITSNGKDKRLTRSAKSSIYLNKHPNSVSKLNENSHQSVIIFYQFLRMKQIS